MFAQQTAFPGFLKLTAAAALINQEGDGGALLDCHFGNLGGV